MPRPWTGRAPLPASKKKPREFDSFKLPPPHKKGVKPVQSPGPFLPGSGPKYVRTREEVLGDPLTKEEVALLIEGCKRTKRQLNMGRDGLTHNMLDNIHALWKRRRVCKIKCKGVCTVDMETVRQQLEERTGGKIIFSKGGVIYLFRGRNYNYKTRPRFPLMLWKPITPVYPRLVQRVPEGLTLEEVADMRKKGHKLIPICKLGKNGVYTNLVAHVREAFEECELARIDCQGMNGSDYRKIGAKLKDLVPCVLLSFANEHILMWRGRDWQPSLPKLDMNIEAANESNVENATSTQLPLQGEEATIPRTTGSDDNPDLLNSSTLNNGSEVAGKEGSEESLSSEYAEPLSSSGEVSNSIIETENISDIQSPQDDAVVSDNSVYTIKPSIKMDVSRIEVGSGEPGSVEESLIEVPGSTTILPAIESAEAKLDSVEEDLIPNENQKFTLEAFQDVSELASVNTPCTEGVRSLLQQALESGSAIILDYTDLDADIVYQKMVAFSRSAPPGPVFRHRLRKVKIKKSEAQEDEEVDIEDLEPQVITTLPTKAGGEKKGSKPRTPRKIDFGEHLDNVVPQGSLRVDELAKLLA